MESEIDGARSKGSKGREAFRTISEVADQLDLPQHVLRFWESKFTQIKPLKRGGNRRYYRPDDVTLITAIKKLLHTEGYTIRGVQKLFKAQGVKATIALALGDGPVAPINQSRQPAISDVKEEPVDNRGGEELAQSIDTPEQSAIDVAALKGILSRLKTLSARLDR